MSEEEAQQASSTALALLPCLPPGDEATALKAFSAAFRPAVLGPVLASAQHAIQQLQASGSPLSLAASGFAFSQMDMLVQPMHTLDASGGPAGPSHGPQQTKAGSEPGMALQDCLHQWDNTSQAASPGSQESGRTPKQESTALYPFPVIPDESTCCQALLHGYSSAWLGLVPAAPASSLTPPHLPGLPQSGLLEPVGMACLLFLLHADLSHRLPGSVAGLHLCLAWPCACSPPSALQLTLCMNNAWKAAAGLNRESLTSQVSVYGVTVAPARLRLAVLAVAGSRLPLPPAYLLLEVTYPNSDPDQSAAVPAGRPPLETIQEEAGADDAAQGQEPAGAALPVGCALLLILGWQATWQPEALLPLSPGLPIGHS